MIALRTVLFSSQFFNVINYLLVFSKFDHEFTWVPLVPLGNKALFEEKITKVPKLEKKNVQIHPIFLQAPNSSFRNLLNPRVLLSDFCKIFRTLTHLRPEAIIVFYVLDAYPIAIFKNLLGYSVFVVATGGDINLHRSPLHTLVRRIIYKQSDMVFAVSNDLKCKIFMESGHRSVILPTGVDPSFFRTLESRNALRKKWKFNNKDIVVLTVSNLEEHKGVDVAIQAIRLLQCRGIENLKLTIVGDGSQKNSLQKLVMKLNLRKSVLFFGEKSRSELLELYNIADLFVLSSHSEGLPFALLEAMACETVCISSPVGDIPSVIKEGYNGFMANSVSSFDFALKLESALSMNDADLAALRKNARRTVLENFDLCKIAENMIDTICNHAIFKNRHEPISDDQGRQGC